MAFVSKNAGKSPHFKHTICIAFMIQKIIKSALFLASGGFLYLLIYNGTLETYIHPRFSYLTLAAALALVVIAVSFFRADDSLAHEHTPIAWWGLLIVLVPVVLGWMVPPRPLGAAAMNTREISVGGLAPISAAQSEQLASTIPSRERNILDWVKLFQSPEGWSIYAGQDASVVGFVYRDERFGPQEFMISRFVISCCVADGQPIGLIVRSPEAAEWVDDQWLQIEGQIEIAAFNGQSVPLLLAVEMEPVDPPAQPYLYP